MAITKSKKEPLLMKVWCANDRATGFFFYIAYVVSPPKNKCIYVKKVKDISCEYH